MAAGAFVSGQPVLPVLLRYKATHLNLGWGIVYTPWHFFRMCTQFVNHLEMDILEPYVPSEGVLCSLSHGLVDVSGFCMGTVPAESACLLFAAATQDHFAFLAILSCIHCCKFPNTLLCFCYTAEERGSPASYANNVRELMASKLGAELSPHGITEQQACKRNGLHVDWLGR